MSIPLHRLKPGQTGRVTELRSPDPVRLDRLGAFGLSLGSAVTVQQTTPVLVFRIGETELAVDAEIAGEIWVQPD
ncbi:MAG: ferrous iron transport protein A [Anaerolineales bacterium]|nr:ferrous iron transport protein A [Anaerolineales bacterium]